MAMSGFLSILSVLIILSILSILKILIILNIQITPIIQITLNLLIIILHVPRRFRLQRKGTHNLSNTSRIE